jgi:hypothetical protein
MKKYFPCGIQDVLVIEIKNVHPRSWRDVCEDGINTIVESIKTNGTFSDSKLSCISVIVDKFWYVCQYENSLEENGQTYKYCAVDCSHRIFAFSR